MQTAVKEFFPLDLADLGKTTAGLLEKAIPDMERKRKWSGKAGIAEMLGERGATYVEEVLAKGGVVLEVGGGKMVAARELAKKYPGGKLVVVEPFADQSDLARLPENMRVVGRDWKKLVVRWFWPALTPYFPVAMCGIMLRISSDFWSAFGDI